MLDLVIISCGGKKLDHSAPAGDLYTGPYFKLAKRAAIALKPRQWLILSAKHGLISPIKILAPYNIRMGDKGSITTTELLRQATNLGLLDAKEVVVLAGAQYTTAARAVWSHATNPLIGLGGMGYQMQAMKEIAIKGDYHV